MAPTDTAVQQLASNSQMFQYVEVLLALAGVLVLAYVLLRIVLPRMLGLRASGRGPIQVLARYPLEPRKTLYLVKTGAQVFLIGTAENQVQYLTAIDAENTAQIAEAARADELPSRDFRQWLSRFQKGGGS